MSGTLVQGTLEVEKYNLGRSVELGRFWGLGVSARRIWPLSDGPGKPTLLAVPPKTFRNRGQIGATFGGDGGQADEQGVLTVQRYGLIRVQQPKADSDESAESKTSKGK